MTPPDLPPDGLVLVNGPPGSVQGPRARALFEGSARIAYKEGGRLGSARPFWAALRDHSQGWIYAIDLGIPAAPLALLRRRQAPDLRLVYELGDPARPLLANQNIPGWQVDVADHLDRTLPPAADALVFRGSFLVDYFSERIAPRTLPPWIWVPDGVDIDRFRPRRDDPEIQALRKRHDLGDRLVVGLVGNIHHNPLHGLFYGWELAGALAHIPPGEPIVGVIVGDGPGRPVLEAAIHRLGVADRIRLIGRVPHEEVPLWMNLFDLGLSTQTDDPVGWGRTTAKLPEYLASGLPVVCTDVGEAHRLLKDSGQTLPYRGMRDESYPERLAARIVELARQDLQPLREQNRELALQHFDYQILRTRLAEFLNRVAPQPADIGRADD